MINYVLRKEKWNSLGISSVKTCKLGNCVIYINKYKTRTSSLLSNSLITVWFYITFYALTFPNHLPASHILNSLPHPYSKHMASTPIFQKAKPTYISFLPHFKISLYLNIFPRGRSAPVPAKTTPPAVLLISNSSTSSGLLFNHLLSLVFPNSFHPGSSSLSRNIFRFPPVQKHSFAQKSKGSSLLTLLKE